MATTLRQALFGWLWLPVLTAQAPPTAERIVVQADAPTHTISPHLYGVFFEEINHAGEGGLWAQLLRNATFEEPGTELDPLPGWSVTTVDRRPAAPPAPVESTDPPRAKLAGATDAPPNAATPRHARVQVEGSAWLVNRGHFGVPIRAGDEYVFSAMMRQTDAQPFVAGFGFHVLDPDGKVVLGAGASVQELQIGASWREVTLRGVATGTTGNGELRVQLQGFATYHVDTVTLRPAKTWKNHGLRADLCELLAALKPAFLRFPGGCYVEGGDKLADAFRWPRTLGPLGDRPGHHNANWGYWTTTGLGYHEYLQLCEDLGAAPMYVANCGLSHREVVPMDQLQPWIDEALAAIEYANGDAATTKWGAVRAAAGHPAPFGLRYLEIGNENGMFADFGGTRALYTQRYEAFRRAIAAKYPDVVTIANVRVDAPMQVVDDHFYMSSGWFWENADRYASPAPGDPQIYVGEYAVTWNPGQTGNLCAALGEAAFLLGLQRAGPHVVMASYAPLFVHVQDRKWNPDLIQFDGLRSCGTPSYHVQALLAQNRPDENLPCLAPKPGAGPGRGSIGLGTWNTEAEFRDVEVEIGGTVVHRSDFAATTSGWKAEAGRWTVVDGAYRQSEGGDQRWTWLDLPELRQAADYTLRCKARKLGGAEGFLVLFHTQGADEWTWWNVGGWGNREHALERCAAGSKFGLGPHARGGVETGRWYDVRIECQGGRIRTFLDGAPVHDVVDRGPPDLAVAAGRCADGTIVVEVVNGSAGPREYPVVLAQPTPRDYVVQVVELTGPSALAENTLDAPATVAPRRSQRPLRAGEALVQTFAPHSLTVLRCIPKN
jgi:alpha-L-arabinofuranosidase